MHFGEQGYANLGLLHAAPYIESSLAPFDHTPDSQSPYSSKPSKPGEKEMDFYTTTSLQELEEFTIPLISSLPSSSLPQTPSTSVEETRSSDITVRQSEELQSFPAYNQSYAMPSSRRGLSYSKYKLRRLPLPLATLFPSQQHRWQASSPLPLQAIPEQSEGLQRSKLEPIPNSETDDEIHKEIRTSAALEVLRTRFSHFDRSL